MSGLGPLRAALVGLRRRVPGVSGAGGGDERRDVAVACQGGGSHAAFTAGVLGRLLADLPDGYRLRGVSGTSGGALCAAAGLYGHLVPDERPADVLESIWLDVAATSAWERWLNDVAVSKVERGATTGTGPSPYATPGGDWGRRQLEDVLTTHIDLDRLGTRLGGPDDPTLLVGAVAPTSGEHVTFQDGDVTVPALVASAAIPELFEAVEVDGVAHWDGLYARNPPLREFVAPAHAGAGGTGPVDELWVIQLTPRQCEAVPRSGGAIRDRASQLVANLSLEQELAHVAAVNEWRRAGHLSGTPTTVRRLSLHDEQAASSKLDRDEGFVRALLADGRAEAVGFLAERRNDA